MNLQELVGKSYVVFGAARSGIGAAKLLHQHGYPVIVVDEKESSLAEAQRTELAADGIDSFWGKPARPELLDDCHVMILSPGIPDSNAFVQAAIAGGMRVISEIELASAFVAPDARVVAITGTNGKTTTTAWTAHLLRCAGLNAVECGNIGEAWSNVVCLPSNLAAGTVFVAEVSSFQLEKIEDFRPQVAILTNLAPDHLDRYARYEDYIDAKRNLLRNLGVQDSLILNGDNPDSTGFGRGIGMREFAFSTVASRANEGAFVEGGILLLKVDGKRIPLIRCDELPIPGVHNVENALAAALACYLVSQRIPDSVKPEEARLLEGIQNGLRGFGGVEHRIEFCGERDGVRYFNDSKATNVDSLEKALKSFEVPIILIAGGRDKKSDYSVLNELVKHHVKKLISIGEAAPLVEAAWGHIVPFERAASMADAVRRSAANALAGDVVLLSPACASYDMYRNYEERGRDFKAEVGRLITE